ncbi:MAG: ATP-dependent zinc metalloprotease FtsH [Calditrichaeota bacterium]|nr:ATP-dependent zinc metalloprotease FtsH [Calditrichota bacterium]
MLTLWALIVLVAYILYNYLNVTEKPEVRKSFTQYRQLIESDQIDAADIIDRELHGRLKDGTAIVVTLPFIDQQMLTEWDSLRIDYQFKEKTTNWVGQILISFLPWLLIIAFWIYLFRRMQGGAGGPKGLFSFGKSRAKLSMEGKPRITFADVAGCDEAKEELKEVIDFLRDPKKFSRLGGRIPKGALLLGPPGTGKTLLARAVAGEAEVPFFSMSGADFVEMFVGVGAARVRDLFETGKKHAPCIIFIDEIDAVGRHRGAGLGGGHDEREQTLNQLLVEMDGFESNEGVILIAATNRPDVLDPALTRPGRFDRQIVVDRPDVRGREGILKVHTKEIPLSGDVRLEVLAKGTPGLAGAELANLANEAALLAARRGAQQVSMNDFEEAKDKVMMGTERKSLLISEDEKRQTAFHEAGHVLVAKLTPGSDPVHKVTIIPRGRALGLTHYLPLDEKHNYSRTYLRLTLSHLLGGRAAEKIVFNEYSTGAGNDIERATEIARKMVCEWGMSDRLGAIALGQKQEEIFLGRELSTHRDFSERTAQEIDSEIRRIVGDAERSAEKTLRENLDKLRLVAEALLEREILDGDEIDILMKGGKLPPVNHRTVEKPAEASSRDGSGAARRERRQRRPQRPFSERRPQSSARPSGDTGESRSPRPGTPPPAGKTSDDGASRSPSQLRRDFARQHGVVSSRDPENRRPLPSEMARRRRDETPRSDSPAEASPPTAAAGEPPAATGEAAHSAERTSSRRRRSRRPRSGSRPTPSGGEGAGGSSQADTPSSGPSEPRSADSDG